MREVLLSNVLEGLALRQKAISPKFLYDKKGSEIFELICRVPEYYPTRTEFEILTLNAFAMANIIGEKALIIEPGSGSGQKVRPLLRALSKPSGYIPIEISPEILERMTEEFGEDFPELPVHPICGDFTTRVELDIDFNHAQKKIVFFPGSTIGNLTPEEAVELLKKFHEMVGKRGGLLIGVDLKKDGRIFKLAYDDPQGVTAAFNLNLLERLNRELGATFSLKNFTHEAFYNEELGRVEMHLKSRISQVVKVHQKEFHFFQGETIHTENSYKYSTSEFCDLARQASWEIRELWKDAENMFCVYYFEKGEE